jgi:N-acetylglucosaminyldiphosphoundecaprenol N-acetyl-beta-D-mannosaminyltransferase
MLEGFTIFDNFLEELPNKKMLINTINAYSYIITKKDALFKESLMNCEILIPDSVSVVWAVKSLFGRKITKIAGADIHQHLLEELDKKEEGVFIGSVQRITIFN